MTIQSEVVYPSSLASLTRGDRRICLTDLSFQQTYSGVIEGAPRPERDARLCASFIKGLEARWGERATYVVVPETVVIHRPSKPIHRLPAVACAAWLVSEPVAAAGAASELVLVWWTESLDLPIGQLVERALGTVRWEQVAKDFDY